MRKGFTAIFCVLLKHTTRTKLSLEFLPSAPFGYRYKAVNSSYTKRNLRPNSLLAVLHKSLGLGLLPEELILKDSVEKEEKNGNSST